MLGCAAEVDDDMNRDRNMDTRTLATGRRFVAWLGRISGPYRGEESDTFVSQMAPKTGGSLSCHP